MECKKHLTEIRRALNT